MMINIKQRKNPALTEGKIVPQHTYLCKKYVQVSDCGICK